MRESKLADKNTPYWWEAAPVKTLPPEPLVGYAGVAAGLVLAREGRSVAAFDAMMPGEGGSSRNHQREHPPGLCHDRPPLR
jgi:hypothetical protein